MEAGGVEAYLLNVLSVMNIEFFEIDILLPGRITSEATAEKFRKLGCHIVEFQIQTEGMSGTVKFASALNKYLNANRYDLVHVNTANLRIESISLFLSKKAEVTTRVAHSHGTLYPAGRVKEVGREILRRQIVRNATHMLACSDVAAGALVGEKRTGLVTIAPNGIHAEVYRFNQQEREKVRQEFSWQNRFVVGFVARISPEKNHLFMLQVVKELVMNGLNPILVIIGTGEESYRRCIYAAVNELGLQDYVTFLGERHDVEKLFQGMDLHVLPSKREALGIVNIEAQCSGLRCLCSDQVPKQADVTGLVQFLSLDKGARVWADCISSLDESYERRDMMEIIVEKGYDIVSSAEIVIKIYRSTVRVGGVIRCHKIKCSEHLASARCAA